MMTQGGIVPAFDGISRKPSSLPQTPWPQATAKQLTPKHSKINPRHKIHLAVIGGIVVVFGIAIVLKPSPQQVSADAPVPDPKEQAAAAPTPVAFAHTAEPTPNAAPLVIDQPTATSIAQPETAAPSTVDASLPTVRILNGSTTSGAATKMRDTLMQAGYTVLSVGDAQFDYIQTMIYYTEGNESAAAAVAEASGNSAITLTENIIASPAQVLLVLGGDGL